MSATARQYYSRRLRRRRDPQRGGGGGGGAAAAAAGGVFGGEIGPEQGRESLLCGTESLNVRALKPQLIHGCAQLMHGLS